jgi:hypothetical protein
LWRFSARFFSAAQMVSRSGFCKQWAGAGMIDRELLIFLITLAVGIAIYTATSPLNFSDPAWNRNCTEPDCNYEYLRP